MIQLVIPVVLVISILSLVAAAWLARQVLSAEKGRPDMQEIASAIQVGAEAFRGCEAHSKAGHRMVRQCRKRRRLSWLSDSVRV